MRRDRRSDGLYLLIALLFFNMGIAIFLNIFHKKFDENYHFQEVLKYY